MWRRPIIPLTDEERDNHLFRIPDDPKRFPVLPELSPKLGERSVTQPLMSTVTVNRSKTDQALSNLTASVSTTEPIPKSSPEPTKMITTEQPAFRQPITAQKTLQLVN